MHRKKMTTKYIAIASASALLITGAHAEQAPNKSLRRAKADDESSHLQHPVLESDYPNPRDAPVQRWWIDWDINHCVTYCAGPPPCGGHPVWQSTFYYSEEECCNALDPSHGRCTAPTLREEVEMLIEESERELIPKFLRLGFHDCVGGCDGCVDLDNPDNKGLLEPIEAIDEIAKRFKPWYSRADTWAIATMVSAEQSLVGDDHPEDVMFPLNHIGRTDCPADQADDMGIGGPNVTMPSNDLTTHELLAFFDNEFGFSAEETVAIMGCHSVAVATRENVGFGNVGEEHGWVFDAEDYVLDNRYYSILVGEGGGRFVSSAPTWKLELVRNEDGIPDRYQWFLEEKGKEERPIMTNADIALVRDLSGHMVDDHEGNSGKVDCEFKEETTSSPKVVCPVASQTIEQVMAYQMDNDEFLYDLEAVLEKMVNNGYDT